MKSDLVDLEVMVMRETDKAILVSVDGNATKAVWLPKSQVETEPTARPRIVNLTLPGRLATEKGLA